jgi:hypothetical protein
MMARLGAFTLGLDPPRQPEERATKGHTASSYRAARREKRLDEEMRKAAKSRLFASEPLVNLSGKADSRRMKLSPLSPTSPRARTGLLSTTILEEVDDSGEDYGF